MKCNKTFGFFLFLLCLASIGIAGCTQNLVATVGPGELGQVGRRGPVKDKISISKHASVEFNEDEADKILKGATEVAQKEDGEGDVSCDITLARDSDEPVAAFTKPTTPPFINSRYDYNTVISDSGSDVKVLSGMNWCEGKFKPDILAGCTAPANSMTVVADLPELSDQEKIKAILWLHEYGHLMGLVHRNDPNAVMNEVVESNHTHLNETECG